jgi:uncharacterized membrane protein
MLTIINFVLVLYVVPFFVSYIGTRWNHTYGKYKTYGMTGGDVFFVVCPLFNIIGAIAHIPAFFMAITGARGTKEYTTDEAVRRFFMAPRKDD